MIFGRYWCEACMRMLNLGTMAPRSLLRRHEATQQHRRNVERLAAAQGRAVPPTEEPNE